MWSLAWAVVLMAICSSDRVKPVLKWGTIAAICLISFPSDWSTIAVMAPFFLTLHRGSFKKQALDIVLWSAVYAAVYFLCLNKPYGVLQLFTALSIPLLSRYNGQRGKYRGMKWLFYIYYPAHLIVVGLIRLALHGDVSILF